MTKNPDKTAPSLDKPKSRKPQKSERQLRVQFTDQELLEKGRKLAEKHGECGRIDAEFDSVKSQFKGKIDRVEAEIGEIAGHLQSGWEYRKVSCETTYDTPRHGLKTTLRLDTYEIVETEQMSVNELQDELPLEDKKRGVDGTGNVTVGADNEQTRN